MGKERLFLKGESISNSTEYDFLSMIRNKIESGVPTCIPISTIKGAKQTEADLEDVVVSSLVGARRIWPDTRSTKPKVVIEVEVNSNDHIRLIKAIGSGYSLSGYSSELKMKVSNLSPNDIRYIEYKQLDGDTQPNDSMDKHTEYNATQKQNKTGESKLKYTSYNNQGFVLSKEKCNLKIIVKKQDLAHVTNNNNNNDTGLNFNVLITGKNKKDRALVIVIDSQYVYYQGAVIGTYNIIDGYSNGYLDIVLDNNDNTDLLFETISLRCESNPHNYDLKHISFYGDAIHNPVGIPFDNSIIFKDLNGNIAFFKGTKISIVSRQKDKSTEALKEWQKDALHEPRTVCFKNSAGTYREAEEHFKSTEIKPTVIRRIPYGKGMESYSSLLKGFVTFPENYEFTFNHKIVKEVTGLIKDVEFDKDTNTTFLEVSFANDTIASRATKLFIEGKMEENTYYILPVPGNKTYSDIRIRMSESTEDVLNYYLKKSNISNAAKREAILKVIDTLDGVKNNESAFDLKRHILATLKEDPGLSPLTRASLNKAIVQLQNSDAQDSNIQEDIPGKIELRVVMPIMSLEYHSLVNNNRKENYLAIIKIMDASFKCPIIDLSARKSTDDDVDKIMVTVSLSAEARKAIEAYVLRFEDKTGVVLGKIIERNTDSHIAHIYIPSQEDLLYYKRHLKDFEGDTKSAEPVIEQDKDLKLKYKSILYPEVKFESFKEAKKYAKAINKGVANAFRLRSEVSDLPILTLDSYEGFEAYVEKATIETSHHEEFENEMAYSVVLSALVPNEIIKKLKEDNLNLEDITQHALENIQICKKGKLKNIQEDSDMVKAYRVLYTYIKNDKIKALAIELE